MATGLAIAGLVTTATTTGLSFAQASKQRKLQKEAEDAAATSMREARKKLEVNFYKGLGIQKEPYELEREALLSTGSQLIQAGVESERGVAGVAGQTLMGQNAGQRNISGAMGQEMQNLDKIVAQEDSRLRDQNVRLDLETAEGAQLAARNREMMANNSLEQGFQGVTSFVDQGIGLAPLYSKTNTPEASANPQLQLTEQAYNTAASTGALDPQFMANGQPLPFDQAMKMFMGDSGMSETAFLDYLTNTQKDIGLKNYKFQAFDDNYGF